MDWTKILYLISAGLMWLIIIAESRLLRKTKRNLHDTDGLLKRLREMPDVVPCYECRFYLENEPFCPKSGMKMKDGLIYCCYGERKEEGSDDRRDSD